jgi:hypothetical protein
MNINKKITQSLTAILVFGLLSLPLTLVSPSEGESVFLLGVPKERLMILAGHLLLVVILALFLAHGVKHNYKSRIFQKLGKTITHQTFYPTLRYVLFGSAVFLSFAFINFSILIPQALSAISGWMAFSAWMIYALFIKYVQAPIDFLPIKINSPFPSWKNLSRTHKRTTLVLLGFGLLYFCLFIPLNLENSATRNDQNLDEMLMLPNVEKMLSAQPNLQTVLYRFLVYGDYINGFLFYGFSALLLLPVKLIYGSNYVDHLQLNMLLLRQFVNVLPAILSCFFCHLAGNSFQKVMDLDSPFYNPAHPSRGSLNQ